MISSRGQILPIENMWLVFHFLFMIVLVILLPNNIIVLNTWLFTLVYCDFYFFSRDINMFETVFLSYHFFLLQ